MLLMTDQGKRRRGESRWVKPLPCVDTCPHRVCHHSALMSFRGGKNNLLDNGLQKRINTHAKTWSQKKSHRVCPKGGGLNQGNLIKEVQQIWEESRVPNRKSAIITGTKQNGYYAEKVLVGCLVKRELNKGM